MHTRYIIVTAFLVLHLGKLTAQSYHNDSMSIEIKFKNDFIVKDYKDLNIDIVCLSKAEGRKVGVYKQLIGSYKSTFGNCYFELYKLDSDSGSYQDITSKTLSAGHPPKDFKNEQEILTYDLEKTSLSLGGEKILTFNLLNFMHSLIKGQYCLKLFIRVGNNYGYDSKGNIITNSIIYIESKVMCFEVIKSIETPNKFPY